MIGITNQFLNFILLRSQSIKGQIYNIVHVMIGIMFILIVLFPARKTLSKKSAEEI